VLSGDETPELFYGGSYSGGSRLSGITGGSHTSGATDDEFVRCVQNYEVVLYKIAYQYVRNEHDAKDMVSETVYKGFKSRKSLKQPEFFRTWITKILISNCLNFLKRSKKIVLSNEKTQDFFYGGSYDRDLRISGITGETQKDGDPLEDAMLMDEALSRLRQEYKTVLLLRYYQDLSIRQTAKVMGVPENTVKTYTDRALKELKNILREDIL
jgi:RNA polymerase sigma-70 factor (ECF subfamily)